MPHFLAQVHEPQRGVRRVHVHADQAHGVAAALGVPPAWVLAVEPVRQRTAPSTGRVDLRLLSQELALLLQSGIPLLEALQTLRERHDGRPADGALDAVIRALQQGLPLSQALAARRRDFDELFVAIVTASERTGSLPASLRSHAAYLAWSHALRAKLVAAAVYPLMLLVVGSAVVLFLLLYVLPRFAGVFDGLGRELPFASRLLIDFGVWAAAHPELTLGSAAALPLLALLVARRPALRQAVAAWAWRLPLIGPRWRVLSLARLYRGLAVLLGAGVAVPAALRLVSGVLAAPLRPALAQAISALEGGQRLSQVLQAHGLATPVALRMLRVGENSGELAAMLERAASFHDEEIEHLSDLVTRAVNPLLMLLMGVLIGGIVVLMYLPIFTLMEQVQ